MTVRLDVFAFAATPEAGRRFQVPAGSFLEVPRLLPFCCLSVSAFDLFLRCDISALEKNVSHVCRSVTGGESKKACSWRYQENRRPQT